MELKGILKYLEKLKANNTREWFNENKSEYTDAKASFEVFTEMLINEISGFDKSVAGVDAKACMFRIFRDVRFSNNKAPYKTNFGAFIASGGRKSQLAGYYVHMEPGASFLGGGIYMPPADNLRLIRKRIFDNPNAFREIINNKEFKKYFDGIYGEKLKTAPRGFPKNWEYIELLNHKHYAVAHLVKDDFWNKPEVIQNNIAIFKVQYELNTYLNEILNQVL
ncbi:MAG: DUF2461 domain-containing protein [Bacteroidales bacterium]|jgi:uncharacterized protein (TIGR02453 family)|nr:DUF2461 domain-containing protein [Bacteroidales bacterium]